MRIIYKQCPKCESKDTMKILYGEPTGEAILSNKNWFGGCYIEIDENGKSVEPEYHCKSCGYEWNKEDAVKRWYSSIEGLELLIFTGFLNGL